MDSTLSRKTVNNKGTEIEYYVSNQVNNNSTLVLSMGIWEPAFRAFPLITRLGSRHCIVPSYRGRGGSSTPAAGFDWQDHASDLACVLENEPLNKPVFLGFSKGVSYLLGYLAANPDSAAGVILIDFPAIHVKAEEGYADFWENRVYNGIELKKHITPAALRGIERESTYKEFYQELGKLNCPVWIYAGRDVNSDVPPNLTDEDISKYKASVRQLEVIDFEYSGHMILDEELGKVVKHVKSALELTDQKK